MKPIITLLIVVLICSAGNAQVFVNHAAAGNNDGTSWANAFTNLHDALYQSDPGEQIWIAAGIYIPVGPTPDSSHFIMDKALEIYGGFAGTEISLEQRDWQSNLTILSGDINGDDMEADFQFFREDNAHHVLIIDAGDQEVIVDGLQFRGGTTRLGSWTPDSNDIIGIHRWRGGAVFIQNTPAMIRNCIFRDNFGYQGSALMATNLDITSEDLIIENSIFELNKTISAGPFYLNRMDSCVIRKTIFRQNQSDGAGGAMMVFNSNVVIHDCMFEDNFSADQAGACFLVNTSNSFNPHPVFEFARCHFIKNSAVETGGAVQLDCYRFGFDLTFDSCSFSNNYALANGSYGGALYVSDFQDEELTEISNQIKFKKCIFKNNSSGYGGAFEIDGTDDSLYIQIEESQFIGNNCFNTYSEGGGIYVWQFLEAKTMTKIDNSYFNGNYSAYAGGAIFSSYRNSYPQAYEINNCIFDNNEAVEDGGAIVTYSNMGLASSIGIISNSQFTGNTGTSGGAIASAGDSLIIEKCDFIGNKTIGFNPNLTGAAAIHCYGHGDVIIGNSTFNGNTSESESGAITINNEVNATLENVLFEQNSGNGVLVNWGNVILRNITMGDNVTGLIAQDSSYTAIQNSIFQNTEYNLMTEGLPEILSKGGNISSDGSMEGVLTGYNGFQDLHNTDPLLGADFVPLTGSPCIDMGNPDGIMSSHDLTGNPRFYGNGIDIGAYESFLVAVKEAVWGDQGFTVYPNLVKDVVNITIESEWVGTIHLSVFDFSGHLVHKGSIVKSSREQTFQTNLGRLAPGEYVLLATQRDVTYATSIIVQ